MISIFHLVSYFAIGECVFACALTIFVCVPSPFPLPAFFKKKQASRQAIPLEGWLFVYGLHGLSILALGGFVWLNSMNFNSTDNFQWAGLGAMMGAGFFGLQAMACFKAGQIAKGRGGRIKMAGCIGFHLLFMLGFASSSLYGFHFLHPIAWSHRIPALYWDNLYGLSAIWLSITLGILMARIIHGYWLPNRTHAFVLGAASITVIGYLTLVPIQAVYLVNLMPHNENGHFEYYRACRQRQARVNGLRNLVEWLPSFYVLKELQPSLWAYITDDHEPSPDPEYRRQLLWAARQGYALDRLWIKEPKQAQQVAEDLIRAVNSIEKITVNHSRVASYLFLEKPNQDLFKNVIRDDQIRMQLHKVLSSLSKKAEKDLLVEYPFRNGWYGTFSHLPWEGYDHVTRAMNNPGLGKPYFTYDGKQLPKALWSPFIDLVVYCDWKNGYSFLGCPDPEVSVHAIKALVASARRRNCKGVHAFDRNAALNIGTVLYYLNEDVALSCMHEAIQILGERSILKGWAFSDSYRHKVPKRNSEFLLAHWHELVPTAQKMNGQGDAAMRTFVKNRLLALGD